MVSLLTSRLRKNHKLSTSIYFKINYSKIYGGAFSKSVKLDVSTDNDSIIYDICLNIFNSYYNGNPIRKVSIALSKLIDNRGIQLNLFESDKNIILEDNLNYVIDNIKNKLGKNSILKASSLLEESTIKSRNKKIGGHHE